MPAYLALGNGAANTTHPSFLFLLSAVFMFDQYVTLKHQTALFSCSSQQFISIIVIFLTQIPNLHTHKCIFIATKAIVFPFVIK